MNEHRRHTFDETLLTGYLDGVLTQEKEQLVRLHLEDCADCETQFTEMRQIRETTMSTTFRTPVDDQWSERPRNRSSRLSLGLGWTILVIWIVAVAGFVVGQIWSGPEGWFEKLLAFGGITGFLLLLVSVALDRFEIAKTDRYRGVEK